MAEAPQPKTNNSLDAYAGQFLGDWQTLMTGAGGIVFLLLGTYASDWVKFILWPFALLFFWAAGFRMWATERNKLVALQSVWDGERQSLQDRIAKLEETVTSRLPDIHIEIKHMSFGSDRTCTMEVTVSNRGHDTTLRNWIIALILGDNTYVYDVSARHKFPVLPRWAFTGRLLGEIADSEPLPRNHHRDGSVTFTLADELEPDVLLGAWDVWYVQCEDALGRHYGSSAPSLGKRFKYIDAATMKMIAQEIAENERAVSEPPELD